VSAKNEQLARSLEDKTILLEEALGQLQSNVEELKETAELRAREKLLGELHDRLGHMLTTAYIGVQAAGVLMDKDISAAKERLSLSQQQMKEAMHSLRKVISGGAIDMDKQQSFTQSVKDLIAETEKQAGVAIRLEALEGGLDSLPAAVRSFLYHALMEGLTNGIRHGEADEFRFKLVITDEGVSFRLCDNGRGCTKIIPGFGLTKMRKEARRLGANLEFSGENGCSLRISVPLRHKGGRHE
jgi:signal transduction histidine kinase